MSEFTIVYLANSLCPSLVFSFEQGYLRYPKALKMNKNKSNNLYTKKKINSYN